MSKITTEDELRTLYGWPAGRAEIKVLDRLEKHGRGFISKSPFSIISTVDASGRVDTSPRGGRPGFIYVIDDHTIAIPDAKGNNRVDSLVNIVDTGRIGMLLMIPGIEETMRINGSAYISTAKDLISRYTEDKNPPKSCIVVEIEEVFLHCAKALMRNKLWQQDYVVQKADFPSMGRMLNDQLGTDNKIETYEEMRKRYEPDL